MELIKDKIMVANLLIIMMILSIIFMAYVSITTILAVGELRNIHNTYVIHVQHNTYEEDKLVSEQPKVHILESKPIIADKPVVEPKLSGDAYLLAQIINAEAKGEPYKGKVAVGNVVMNRVNHPDFPDTIKEVIFQKGQFSPVANGAIYEKPNDDSIKAAREVLNGTQIVGEQALYFYNPRTATSDWIFTRKTLLDIGNHRFAR